MIKKYLGDSKQKTFEKELKADWNKESKRRGQQTLTSGTITSSKLSKWGF